MESFKYSLKVFKPNGDLYFSVVCSLGALKNFIEDFDGLGFTLKVYELNDESEVK